MAIDASSFAAPASLDGVPITDQNGNAYVQIHQYATLLREAVDSTGTTVPSGISAGELSAYTTAKAALLTALDTVIANARTITNLL